MVEVSIPTPQEKDYELTFEGRGSSYAYGMTFCEYCLPPDVEFVSIIESGVVKEFISKRCIALMNEEGRRVTFKRVQAAMEEMDNKVAAGAKEIEALLRLPLTAQIIHSIFRLSGEVTRAYYFFDPHFFEALYERVEEDADARASIETVQAYKNKAREYFNAFYFGEGFVPRLLRQLSTMSGVPESDLVEYDENELAALCSGHRVDPNLLAARREAFILVKSADASLAIYVGEDAHTFARGFSSNPQTTVERELRGKCAHKTGQIVRGPVRLITRDYMNAARMLEEMQAMREGEILVTQTTDPEMMPALRKASAAITDIGGMLSHTAITARELNIPCIVDTKIATKIFKNGDVVEVDAERGVVRRVFL